MQDAVRDLVDAEVRVRGRHVEEDQEIRGERAPESEREDAYPIDMRHDIDGEPDIVEIIDPMPQEHESGPTQVLYDGGGEPETGHDTTVLAH